MFDQVFAARLLEWANRAFFGFLALGISGAVLAYGFGAYMTMALEGLGHWFIALGAFGVKTSYIARLAALDVLRPHPDGWLREAAPPDRLPRLKLVTVSPLPTSEGRKRA